MLYAMNKGYPVVYKDVFTNPSARELARVIVGMDSENKSKAAADFDYTAINDFIAFNAMEHVDEISSRPLGNIILTGAQPAFLGFMCSEPSWKKQMARSPVSCAAAAMSLQNGV